MTYKADLCTPQLFFLIFIGNLERYTKKYRHLKEAVIESIENFRKDSSPHIGNNIYKLRLRTKDMPRGKSKSFRLLLLVTEEENYLVPLVLHFKGDKEDLTKKEINRHLEVILFETRMQKFLRV